ncbi:MAG: serine hydrolase [Defluviitaleaceae bacterium]|nr:serine hydrolase [Defluviitaleaceae bacterium]
MKRFIKTAISIVLSALMTMSVGVLAFGEANLPLRQTFEEANAVVDWVNGSVTISYDGNNWVFTPGETVAQRNGVEIELSTPILLVDGRTFISADDLAMIRGEQAKPFDQTIELATQLALEMMAEFGVTGASIAFVDAESGFSWTQGFGYADSVNGLVADEYTLFQIGSTSKPFTAIAIMQLVEQGVIDLDELIVTYLPEFSMLPSFRFGGNSDNVTTRMLLSNTSGVPSEFARGNMSITGYYYQGLMNGGLLEFLSLSEMSFEEGTMYEYSNMGWALLGIIAARMSGYTNYFEGFVLLTQENIFAPLGMERSSFVLSEDMTNIAMSYLMAGQQDDFTILASDLPAGSMFSNAHDMARFMHTLLGDGTIGGNRLLEQETIAYMMQSHTDHVDTDIFLEAYGLGFLKMASAITAGIQTVGHGGTLTHYHTEMILSPESGLGVFVTTNSVTGAAITTSLASAILDAAVTEKNIDIPRDDAGVIDDLISLALEAMADMSAGYLATEDFKQWVGDYHFVPEIIGEVFTLSHFGIGVNEDGLATIAMGHIVLGLIEMPLTYYEGRWFFGFDPISFGINDQGDRFLNVWGTNFVMELDGI